VQRVDALSGLTRQEAEARRRVFGPNALEGEEQVGMCLAYAYQTYLYL
jgi:hypothetical protein